MRAIINQKEGRKDKVNLFKHDTTAKKGHIITNFDHFVSEFDRENYESLDSMLTAFGGVARFAPLLSIAKKSQITGYRAKQLQHAIQTNWVDSGKTVDDVFDMLELSNLRERGIRYESLDSLAAYIPLYNQKHFATVDMPTYLRQKFGDGELAMMILEGAKIAQVFDESAVWSHVGNGKPIVQYVSSILEMPTDVDKLLDPLLAVCGSAANLVFLLTTVKLNSGSWQRAKRLQHLLLTSWVGSGKTVNDVFDLLGLSNLRKKGLTYESLDSLAAYFQLYNYKHSASGDMLTYLRQKFGDGELAMMILEGANVAQFSEVDVRDQVGQGKMLRDYISKILAISTDVDKLLDPLSAASGGVAKLVIYLTHPTIRGTSETENG